MTDVLLPPAKGVRSLVSSAPLQMIEYGRSAYPALATAVPGSDLAATIEAAGCGWIVEPESPQALAAAIREVRALPLAERVRRGLAGRDYAMNHLTREVCLPQVIELLEQIAFGGLPAAQSRSDSAASDKTDG